MTGVVKLCQCCFKPIKDQAYVDMRVKVGDPSGLCIECLSLYAVLEYRFPNKSETELRDQTRFVCCYETLPPDLKLRMHRLLFLLQNNSRRARRLLDLAAKGQLDLSQLLAIV